MPGLVSADLYSDSPSFFSFDNYSRNEALCNQAGYSLPKATSTGTTIVGLVYKDGVVLGADTRATNGPIVADKNCEKIHYLSPTIYCCGAGTAADTEFTTAQIRSSLDLFALNGDSKRKPRIITAMTMLKQKLFNYQGHIGAALIVGGVDATGAHLYTVHPHGSTDKLPFVTMGSGSLAAMAVFEAGYLPNLTREQAVALVSDAIQAGIFNDLGSGSNVDIVVIPREEQGPPEVLRGYLKPNQKPQRQLRYSLSKGTTVVVKEDFYPYTIDQ